MVEIKTFISYSHDTPKHLERVLELSNKLRDEGINSTIDQYHDVPEEGWPIWCAKQLRDSSFVLVVCTETYFRRAMGLESPGVGRGVTWEGFLITQAFYNSSSKNKKYIPVIFEESDKDFVPEFLSATSIYNIGSTQGHESLYRYLTGQPKVVPPPIGKIRVMEPFSAESSKPIALNPHREIDLEHLLFASEHHLALFDSLISFKNNNDDTLDLEIEDADASEIFFPLKKSSDPFSISYRNDCFLCRLSSIDETIVSGKSRIKVNLKILDLPFGAGSIEAGYSNISADEIAVMRAKRILLNENPSKRYSNDRVEMNDVMLDVLIQGTNSFMNVTKSPFIDIYKSFGKAASKLVPGCRLMAISMLKLSGTVETISEFSIVLESGNQLRVHFKGKRFKKYINEDPYEFEVNGVCQLEERN